MCVYMLKMEWVGWIKNSVIGNLAKSLNAGFMPLPCTVC